MLNLTRFDLTNPSDWKDFIEIFDAYLHEVCTEDEYTEEIACMHNTELNEQLICQTLQNDNPYFVMRIDFNEQTIGLVSYSYHSIKQVGFINNFYISPLFRNSGFGTAVCSLIEKHIISMGGKTIELSPIDKAEQFYLRNGYTKHKETVDGEAIYHKTISQDS